MGSECQCKVGHTLSMLGEVRAFLEENLDASNVAIKCINRTFR